MSKPQTTQNQDDIQIVDDGTPTASHHKFVPKLLTDYSEKQTLTVKYWFDPKEIDSSGQLRKDIDKTLELSCHIYDEVLHFIKENHTCGIKKIHDGTYDNLKKFADENKFPTAYIQTIRDDCRRDMKSWNSNHSDKRWQLDSKRKKTASVALDRRTLTFKHDRMEVTVSKIGKRFKAALDPRDAEWFFKRHENLAFDMDAKAGRLGKKLKHGKWCYYIAISYRYTPAVPRFDPLSNKVKGIDRGMCEPFVTSDGDVAPSAKDDHAISRKYAYNAANLKAKGTKSARRKLRLLSGKKVRFSQDCARRYAHEILGDMNPGDVLVVEDLTGINANTIARYEHSAEYNRRHSAWNHAELLSELVSLAFQRSVFVVAVDPAYSSQECPRCGFVSGENRLLGGFECHSCGFVGYADACAALVIRGRGYVALLDCLPAKYWKQGDVKLPNEVFA